MLRTLRSKLQVLFTLLILTMGGMVIAWFALQADQSVNSSIQQDSESATRVLTSLISEKRDGLLDKASLLKDDAQRALRSGSATRRGVAKQSRLRSRSDGVVIADERGAIISTAGLDAAAAGKGLRVGFKSTAAGRDWTGVVSVSNRLYIAGAVRVEGGGSIAVMTAVDAKLAKRLRDSANADIVFLKKGKIVAASMKIDGSIPKREGAIRIVTIGGRQYVAQAAPFPGTKSEEGITFLAINELEKVVAPLRSLGVMFVTALLAALACAIALTGWFSRTLTRPLDTLMRGAEIVRDGRWPEPMPVERQDEIGMLQGVFNEMTSSLKSSQERLLHLIDIDPLTELDNHRRFKERLDQEVFRACMAEKPMALALFDLDRFGDYNQQFGPAAGDEALQTFASILREAAPDIAFLGRYGGEEFAMLMPMNSLASTEATASRVRKMTEGRFLGPLTVSVGIAELGPGIGSGAGLLLSCELALGRAKQLGRDRICFFDAVPGATDQHDPFRLQQFLEDSTFAAIGALAGAVDAKDPYTQGHSLRVAKFAADLAKYVGEPPETVDLVYRTGTLHDVGKIGVPDSILTKPTRLNPDELAIMETHTVLGELIVKRAPQLDDMLPGVRHHHERWDGRGYPDRLMGDQIPRLARFISVADTFDAMTSDRPYRQGLSDEAALAEIERSAGTQFDPALALSFVRMMRLHGHIEKAA